MGSEFIQTDVTEGVLTITMHDPPTRNALGPDMAREMVDRIDQFEADPDERVLLLTGTEPSFCSGANVRGFSRRIQDREARSEEPESLPWGKMEARFARNSQSSRYDAPQVVYRIHQLQKPSVAAVNGHAVGVGMGLALACDIRVAAEKAVFSEAFVLRGLIPADGSCWQLPRLIGLSNTLLLQYTGDRVDGNEAFRLGLASKVFPDGQLLEEAQQLASRLAHGPTQSYSLIKYLVHQAMDSSLSDHLELARVAQEHARQTEDHKEAVQAFLEKRRPDFKGR